MGWSKAAHGAKPVSRCCKALCYNDLGAEQHHPRPMSLPEYPLLLEELSQRHPTRAPLFPRDGRPRDLGHGRLRQRGEGVRDAVVPVVKVFAEVEVAVERGDAGQAVAGETVLLDGCLT